MGYFSAFTINNLLGGYYIGGYSWKGPTSNDLVKEWAKKIYVFFGRLFRQTSNVDILETVCSNDLKFEVRIVLDRVPLQIKLSHSDKPFQRY